MSQRFLVVLFLCLTFVRAANAAGTEIVGTLTKIEPGIVELKADDGQTRSIAVTEKTSFMKWIMQKPWQQDPRIDRRLLAIGTRVRIEVARDNPNVARVIWVVARR